MSKSIFAYLTFGLREDWLLQYLRQGQKFFNNNSLGPIQLESFIRYLIDCGLIDKNFYLTKLTDLLKKIQNHKYFLWGIIWINLCFSSLLYKFWTNYPIDIYNKENILKILSQEFPKKSTRSILNAYMSLVSTFERTPIGDELKQGRVIKKGNQRIVIKEGNPDVPFQAIIYNLYKFAEYYKMYSFTLKKIENMELSPQKIFAMETSKVENILKKSWNSSIFKVNLSDNEPLFILNNELTSLDVLSILIGGKDEI